jgi:hypothetical protein
MLLGAALGALLFTFRGRLGFFHGVFTSAGALLLSAVVNIYRAGRLSGTNIILAQIDEAAALIGQALESLPPGQAQRVFGVFAAEHLTVVKELYTVMFPSILILNTLLLSYAAYMAVKQVLALLKRDVSRHPKFSELKLRRSAAVALGVSYLLPLLAPRHIVFAAISNITVVISGVAFVCGLSFADFKVRRVLKSAWIRLTVYIAAFFVVSVALPLLMLGFALIAVADAFLDFRGLRRREVSDDGQ